ncbi:hypothetical protein U5922_015205 [Aquicoccus sp. G2-2]|jgi:hypothetical protein|uniref:hypothetical protein n=1 Tax=Aquicoccus sp. G2-2 TaxID=3092120 RepID=UPI002AE08614|nr:hypothetical protein [Aquicoccus sp. G2-2]MEA1114740.1 hypothetical protein [Aquicoccus sp. G2-2]
MAFCLGVCAVATAIPAHADDVNNCATRDQVVSRLQQEFYEELTAGGLQDSGAAGVVEVWSSPQTGTFTVMMTRPDGVSCILATGTDWYEPKAQARMQQTAG